MSAASTRYRRTGTLWEGRFKSALVDSERYVLTCHHYIELNPVRAAMVGTPAAYRWSSHARNASGAHEPRITPHPACRALGPTASDRELAYRALFVEAVSDADLTDLRIHTQQQKAWGSERFRQQIEALTERAAGIRPRGRPRSSNSGDK